MKFLWRRERKFGDLRPLASRSVFIVGNGPSLKGSDLDMLHRIPTFASNAIYLIFDKTGWRPDFYSCVDTAVLPDRANEINYWVKKLPKTTFVFPEEILAHGDRIERKRVPDLVNPRRNVRFFNPLPLDLEDESKSFDFSKNTNVLRESMTVTITLMQMAVKLGANRLFLIGCDTDYFVPKEANVLDLGSKRVDKRIVLNTDSDPNHFDKRYFGRGKVWHTPNTKLMIKHYEIVNRVCEKNGVSIINAGRGGKLEVFPRIELEEAVKKAKGEF